MVQKRLYFLKTSFVWSMLALKKITQYRKLPEKTLISNKKRWRMERTFWSFKNTASNLD